MFSFRDDGRLEWVCPYCGHCEAYPDAASDDWVRRLLDVGCLYCMPSSALSAELIKAREQKAAYLALIDHILSQLVSDERDTLIKYLNLDGIDNTLSFGELIYNAALDSLSSRTSQSIEDYLEDGSFAYALYEIIGAFSFDASWDIVFGDNE